MTVGADAAGLPGHDRRDVAGPGHGEPAAGLVIPADPRPVGGSDVVAGPGAARPGARPADVIEDGGVLAGGDDPVFSAAEALGDRLVRRGGGEQPGLDGRRQPGQADGADLGPVRAVGRLVAGDRVAGAGQPQPARGCRGDGARLARRVVGVVVLHPHPVVRGDHHRRVRRSRLGALLDDDPGLGPRHEAGSRADPGAVPGRDQAGQRGDPDGDAAVPGQRLAHEVEAVAHRLASRPHRGCGRAALAGPGRAAARALARAAAGPGGEQPEPRPSPGPRRPCR